MDTQTVLYILSAVIAALAISVFQYIYKASTTSRVTILLAFLRFLGIFLTLLLLVNPKIETEQLSSIKPKLVVAVDNSASIAHLEAQEQVHNVVNVIKNDDALAQKFDIDYFSFSNEISTYDSLQFNQVNTDINSVITNLNTLYKENAAVVLVTDGNQTYGSDYSFYKSTIPIYPIAVGDTITYEDLKIATINVNKYSFLGNQFPVELFVNYDGQRAINAVLTVSSGNQTVFRKTISLNKNKNSEKVNLNLAASAIGITNYRASISTLENEKNTINNRKNFSIEVINEQSKIALISAISHPDIGMLKRSIETNEQRKVILKKPSDQINIADYQLVILYQPSSSFSNLFEQLEIQQTNSFIITGAQTDWNFLNRAQQNFSKEAISTTEQYLSNYNPTFNAFVVDDINFIDFPPLEDYFGEISFSVPFDVLLYQNINGFETENPLLATFSENTRKGAILFGEHSWKWRAASYLKSKSYEEFDTFINKLVQYLAMKQRLSRLELTYEPIVYQNEQVQIKARYFDANYVIDARANLTLSITNSETNEQKRIPFVLNSNIHQVNLNNLESGAYDFVVSTADGQHKKSGKVIILDYSIEQQFNSANIEGLDKIAKNSNGIASHVTNLGSNLAVLKELDSLKTIQKSTKKTVPLIDWKWLLAMIILCFSSEWFIRKYKGLI